MLGSATPTSSKTTSDPGEKLKSDAPESPLNALVAAANASFCTSTKPFKLDPELAKEREEQEEALRELKEANQKLNARVSELNNEKQQITECRQNVLDRLALLTGAAEESGAEATPYDLVFQFQSLFEVVGTGKIELCRAAASNFDVTNDNRCRIVAVVGLFDKGKTFLINKLFGVNLSYGKLHSTQGLSFLWFEKQRMLIMDTAGAQAPVSCRSLPSKGLEPMFDAQSTESLIFEMIPRLAHHVIFVVNDLTWGEQDYITKMTQKFVQCERRKELIVVHNMRCTRTPFEAEELFQRQIGQLYDGEKSHLANLIYTSDHGANMPCVHHVGICDDSSVAGDRYNQASFKVLVDMLEHRESLGTPVNLAQLLQTELQRLLPLFLNVEPTVGSSESQQMVVTYEKCEKPIAKGDQYLIGDFVVRTKAVEQRLLMKTRGTDGSLGSMLEHDHSFRPQVNIFDQPVNGIGERRVIQIECPGVRTENVTVTARPTGVKITIVRMALIEENVVKPVEEIRQHHGRFEKEFIFGRETGRYDICDESGWYLEDGILNVFLKQQQDRTVSMASKRPAVASAEA